MDFIKPSSRKWRSFVANKSDSIKPIFLVSCHFPKLVESWSDVESCRESLSSYLFDHIRANDWVGQKIHHERTLGLWVEYYFSLTFCYGDSFEKVFHLFISRFFFKSRKCCYHVSSLYGSTIWPGDIIFESTFYFLNISEITSREISSKCSCFRIVSDQASQ